MRGSPEDSLFLQPDESSSAAPTASLCDDKIGFCRKNGRSLREWLNRPSRTVDWRECVDMFQQVLQIVVAAHSRGIVLMGKLRPSFLMISHCGHISSSTSSLPGSETRMSTDLSSCLLSADGASNAGNRQQFLLLERVMEIRFSRANSMVHESAIVEEVERPMSENEKQNSREDALSWEELEWYRSPEELEGAQSTFQSDMYRLGVLLFELFAVFQSMDKKLEIMSNLRSRVLPTDLLLKWPEAASFCLLLLHPQPNSRPTLSQVCCNDFLSRPKDGWMASWEAIKLKEEIEGEELLLEFLLQMERRKREAADKLCKTICFLSSDIEEVASNQSVVSKKRGREAGHENKVEFLGDESTGNSFPFAALPVEDSFGHNASREKSERAMCDLPCGEDSVSLDSANCSRPASVSEEVNNDLISKRFRLMKNFKRVEAAYFSRRSKMVKSTRNNMNRKLSSLCRLTSIRKEGSSVDNSTQNDSFNGGKKKEWINPFLQSLCSYLSFSKLQVRAELKQSDFSNSSNLVCSLGFDRDRELFATAGVNKKIKIFECDMILSQQRDINYPLVELSSTSKLSSICWNSYIKNQIASCDFDGIVQVWDITKNQSFMEMQEHTRRVWSVDYSAADPTILASGSDDGTVKFWNMNQEGSISTIRTKANVCSVQFAPQSAYFVAIGSADHKIYCYDRRHIRVPSYILEGHAKTVSYVKFMDSMTLVSASTDSTLKLWDLSKAVDNPVQTFTGHTNVKNFVGLSVSDRYIATGSETNEIYIYHREFPMPVLSYKFSCEDPISGHELDNATQFVSCVCWRGQTSTLLATNSSGNVKILEMV